jgi:hypothetical protein
MAPPNKQLNRGIKAPELLVGKFSVARIVCSCEVGHYAVDPQILKQLGCIQEIVQAVAGNPEPPHPGIYLEVVLHQITGGAGSAIERFQGIEPERRRRQAILNHEVLLTLPEPRKAKDRFFDPGLSQREAFLR